MIPSSNGQGFLKLNRELERRFHVKDPKSPHNEIMCEQPNLGNHSILSNSIIPLEVKVDKKASNLKDKVWHLYFDSAASRHGKGVGIVLKSPLGHIFKFAYRL